MARTTIAVPALLALLAGCGTGAHTLPGEGERVPITQRAVAAIMLDHLPQDTSSRQATHTDEQDPPGMLGADLRYSGDGEYDGDLLRTVLEPGTRDLPCDERCVELDTDVAGATLTLHWDEEAPEADPGIIGVTLQRDGEFAYVYQAGPTITGDPRELDLEITVDDMVAVVEDPWLRLRTSPDAVAAGEDLDDWEGGSGH